MTSNKKDPVLVVLQMSGAYDALNTIIPYNDPHYADYRQELKVEPDQVLAIDDNVGFHPSMAPIKDLYDQGKVAVIQGIGYPNPIRSHFRSMDIWHTAEPAKMATEGWLGRAIKEIDPQRENVLTAVNFGRGLPRALAMPGVSVASVGSLDSYGVLTGIDGEDQRSNALDIFARMYSPMIGSGPANEYLSQTGLDALKGADILDYCPPDVFVLGGVQRGTCSPSGSRISPRFTWRSSAPGFSTTGLTPEPSTPTPTSPPPSPSCGPRFPTPSAIVYQDLKEHNSNEEVVILLFTEFGRRVQENGSGTDHGSGSVAFVMGDAVKGGLYGEYPSLESDKLDEGDLQWNNDFRCTYATLLDKWMGLDDKDILKGSYEQFDFIK